MLINVKKNSHFEEFSLNDIIDEQKSKHLFVKVLFFRVIAGH